ncbi:S41 family peptidase [Streptococcus hillyeri]|uniref:Peptidase S41 n=1 Tax=Streptococcus hillyeri TaxID=2282420 RepID=A0A3L9DTK8_9STRE|nr:S41 family peptidase [Streptococcus hillyeri]RLY03608.1 peptidase S41 [Streptococcus hillyeri]
MQKIDIFDQVVLTAQNDSSAKKDKMGANPLPFRKQISEEMSDDDFVFLVNNYLASFGVLSHLTFYKPSDNRPVGFRLRYQDKKLYVITAREETGLEKGDIIIALDKVETSQFYQDNQELFVSKTPERQYMDWAKFLVRTQSVTVFRAGKELEVVLQRPTTVSKTEPFVWKLLDNETVYLKMENFSDEGAISTLYQESKQAIENSPNLIIDVRTNHGGSDSLYWPLFNYTLGLGKKVSDLPEDDVRQEFFYTERNVDLRLEQFEKDLNSPDITEETRRLIEEFASLLRANRGKGYVPYDSDEDNDVDFYDSYIGQEFPKRVVVLADVYCGSSGDSFVAMMKRMPKVTVMGRPTMGINDYSNCCVLPLDDYRFIFPTSRLLTIDKGQGQTDKGIEPDILIPWTEEHLSRDVDLEKALLFLKEH